MKRAETLSPQDIIGQVRFALFKDFADAHNGNQPSLQSRFKFQVHRIVGLAKILAALRMANDDMGCAGSEQHFRRDFPGECALLFPIEILAANRDVGIASSFHGSRQINERRTYGNLIARNVSDKRKEITKKVPSLIRGLEHLPV